MTDNVTMMRAACRLDLPGSSELERAAGAAFRDLGMAAVADDEPASVTELATFQQDGRAWVVTDDWDRPVAYLLIDTIDGNAHVEQSPCTRTMPGRVMAESSWTPPRCGPSSTASLPSH